MDIFKKLATLIDVKTITTFAIVTAVIYLAVAGKLDAEKIYALALMIITFFFAKQNEAK